MMDRSGIDDDDTVRLLPRPAVARHRRHGGRELVIGLVNTMPAAAMRGTETRFRALACAAPNGWTVRLRVFSRPENDAPREGHETLNAIWDADLDALIVTGAEPRTAAMRDEPAWPLFASLVDWARENTISTYWSCMAAHAAVHRLDGLERTRLAEKCFGVFACEKASNHVLTGGAPPVWSVPHSRWNDLGADALREHGYQILSQAREAGADLFVKRATRSLFVLSQGHPEYAADSLPREYRRDIRRFLDRARDTWPALPLGCFDAQAAARFEALAKDFQRDPTIDPEAALKAAFAVTPVDVWTERAACLFARWVGFVAARKAERRRPEFYQVRTDERRISVA